MCSLLLNIIVCIEDIFYVLCDVYDPLNVCVARVCLLCYTFYQRCYISYSNETHYESIIYVMIALNGTVIAYRYVEFKFEKRNKFTETSNTYRYHLGNTYITTNDHIRGHLLPHCNISTPNILTDSQQ